MRFASSSYRSAAVVAVLLAVAALPFNGCRAAVVAHRADDDGNRLQQAPGDELTAHAESATGNWAAVARIAGECTQDAADAASCMAVKVAAALERAARAAGPVQLLPGLTVSAAAATSQQQRDSRALPAVTEDELRGQLQQRSAVDVLADSALRFLQSRTFEFRFPQTDAEQLSRAIEEGRGKLKKKVLPILGLLAVKIAAVLPILLGIIGFFALKALLFGKLALLIAGVMAFQKYASAAGAGGFGKIADGWSSANVVSPWQPAPAPAPASNGGGYYRRSMDAQQMAYNGQQPSAQSSVVA